MQVIALFGPVQATALERQEGFALLTCRACAVCSWLHALEVCICAGGAEAAVAEADLRRLRLVRGLSNDSGFNNCFLNVVIQSLWHLRAFREALLGLPPQARRPSLQHRSWAIVRAGVGRRGCRGQFMLATVSAAYCGATARPAHEDLRGRQLRDM